MTDAATDTGGSGPARTGRGGLRELLLGLVLALAGAAGGYLAATSGLVERIAGSGDSGGSATESTAFLEVPPMVVTVARPGGSAQLRLKLSLEVAAGDAGEVSVLMPRVIDVLNTYLRALETIDLEDPTTLVRLRSQMLRRIQVVVGGDMVRDLLFLEFVVN